MDFHTVFLGIGSNLGEKEKNIETAILLISDCLGHVSKASSLYYSKPQGFSSANEFVNVVVVLETQLCPDDLLIKIQQIERDMGRVRIDGTRYSDRVIDIDILLYDSIVLSTKHLQIPHPRMSERGFVLLPISEVAPLRLHPVLGETMSELADRWRE